jgi:hypothetical protein
MFFNIGIHINVQEVAEQFTAVYDQEWHPAPDMHQNHIRLCSVLSHIWTRYRLQSVEATRGLGSNGEISNDPFRPVQQKGGCWTFFNIELQEIPELSANLLDRFGFPILENIP